MWSNSNFRDTATKTKQIPIALNQLIRTIIFISMDANKGLAKKWEKEHCFECKKNSRGLNNHHRYEILIKDRKNIPNSCIPYP